jgi:hypothetical protein
MNQHPGGSPGQHGNSFRNCLTPPLPQQQQEQATADCTARVSIAATLNPHLPAPSPHLHPPTVTNAADAAAGERIKHEANTAAYANVAQLLKQKYLAAQSTVSSSPAYSIVSPEAQGEHLSPQQGGVAGGGGAVAALSGLITSGTMDHSVSIEGSMERGAVELARSFGRPPSVPRRSVKQCAPARPSPATAEDACHFSAASDPTNDAT